jgi:hypothetical protein
LITETEVLRLVWSTGETKNIGTIVGRDNYDIFIFGKAPAIE